MSPLVYRNFVHVVAMPQLPWLPSFWQTTLLKTTATASEVNASWPMSVNHRCYLNIHANSVRYGNRRQS